MLKRKTLTDGSTNSTAKARSAFPGLKFSTASAIALSDAVHCPSRLRPRTLMRLFSGTKLRRQGTPPSARHNADVRAQERAMAIAEVRCLRTACGKPSTSELAETFGKALERTQAFVCTCSADRCFEAES